MQQRFNSNHRKHRYEVVKELMKQVSIILIDEKLAIEVIMHCRITPAHNFGARLGFKEYDVILTKEHWSTKIISSFEGEILQTQYNNLSYRTDLYFHDQKLAIELDENGHNKINIDYKIKRQKAIEQEIGCKFIRINPDKEEFDIIKNVNEILRHIKQSTKKLIINKFQRDY